MSEAPADEPKGFGLVDELDTPAPGHMASKPNPLTATTSSEPPTPSSDPTTLPSLSDRFVKESGDAHEVEKKEIKEEGGGEESKNEDAEVEVMVLSQEGSDP